MTAKHSPGPFTAQGFLIEADRVPIARVIKKRGMSKEEAAANVRLFAAAPDLLGALRNMVSDNPGVSSATMFFACFAISKAIGEDQ